MDTQCETAGNQEIKLEFLYWMDKFDLTGPNI